MSSFLKATSGLNVPSRLKGMETPCDQCFRRALRWSECAFPFEGNGNPTIHLMIPLMTTGLNVPSRLKGMETILGIILRWRATSVSECAFPFEGNGNPAVRKTTTIAVIGLTVPSRLKGIETIHLISRKSSHLTSDCAFPFEGNRNVHHWYPQAYSVYSLPSDCAFPFEGN